MRAFAVLVETRSRRRLANVLVIPCSAFGMLTGNQETMKEGNLKAEKAEWKASAAEGTVPLPSKERLVGKAER